jgi:Immunity protein 8
MKKAEIKSYMISDFLDPNMQGVNIDLWEPDDKEYFEFWMQISIGIEVETGADDFNIHVVSQRMLSSVVNKKYLLVVPYFEGVKSILDLVNRSIEDCAGSSWQDISTRISNMYHWEYENYKI